MDRQTGLLLATALLVSSLLETTVSPVMAQEALDTVHLQNGGIVRGTVLEYEPGADVVIRAATGTVRTIEASEVASVEIAGDTPVAPAASEPIPEEGATPEPEPTVHEVVVVAGPEPRRPEERPPPRDGSDAPVESGEALGVLPGGSPHFGLQVGLGGSYTTSANYYYGDTYTEFSSGRSDSTFTTEGAGLVSFELAAQLDFVLMPSRAHLRLQVGLQLSNAPTRRLVLRSGRTVLGEQTYTADGPTTAPLARLLLGFDLTSWFALRLGPRVAVELYPASGGTLAALVPMATLELTFRLLDDRRLELGLVVEAGASIPVSGGRVVPAFQLPARAFLGYVF